MAHRIVFGLMASHEGPGVVAQLADTLSPYRVVIHQDLAHHAGARVVRPNVHHVPDPVPTGWGSWGFCQAILRTMRHALQTQDCDYFQLLSASCLPIRPLADFQCHIDRDRGRIHADLMPVDINANTLMTFAYRTYLPGGGLRFRLMRRARRWYFGPDADLVQTCSLSVLRRQPPVASVVARQAGFALTRMAVRGRMGNHPFAPDLKPAIGSIWFGAHREVCEDLLRRAESDPRIEFFRRLHIVDETLFPTLLANAGVAIAPSNHVVNAFDEQGHPARIDGPALDRLAASGRFFARKFSTDTADPVRRRAIEMAEGWVQAA